MMIDNHKQKQQNETIDNKNALQDEGKNNIAAQEFTFLELATATKNFRQECLIGEGGFGRVYQGKLEKTGQIVAVKQLDRNGLKGNREFLDEVLMLSLLHHQNLVNLIGYYADGCPRLLVYEYMPLRLEDHLLNINPRQTPLDWSKRIKIGLGVAKGLEYLHDKANPPVIYRHLKSSNILLDKEYNAKLKPARDKPRVASRAMYSAFSGSYYAPEYHKTGQLTVKSDVYSFGVVLLELITGRRSIDSSRPNKEQNLVTWARLMFKDRSKSQKLADPRLKRHFSKRALYQAVAVAIMCVAETPSTRPLIGDVVNALSYLCKGQETSPTTTSGHPPSPSLESHDNQSNEPSEKERQQAVAEAIEWGSNLPPWSSDDTEIKTLGLIWKSNAFHRFKMFLWRVLRGTLITMDSSSSNCPLCDSAVETEYHLFAACNLARSLWFAKWGIRFDNENHSSISHLLEFILSTNKPSWIQEDQRRFRKWGIALMYIIWKVRNHKVFDPNYVVCCDNVKEEIARLSTEIEVN